MTADVQAARWKSFQSLRVRNYRLYMIGQVVSTLGTWLSLTAMSWMVLTELGGNATHVGFLAASQFLPTLIFGTWAGAIADRVVVRRLLVSTQTALLLVATSVAVLKYAGVIRLWMVFPLVAAQGLCTAFDNPSRQAFVSELVGPDLIPNAVALNSAGFNCARIVGPSLAGIIIAASGTQLCFALNAVSYLAAIAALLLVNRDELFARPAVQRAKGQIREGFRYAREQPVLRNALLTMAVVGTVSMNFTVLVPLLARTTFKTGAGSFGLLSTAMGVGSLIGALLAARRTNPTLTTIARGAFGLSVAMFATALSPGLPVAMISVAVCGVFVMTYLAATNSVLQLNARPEMRGRVLSLYLVLFVGTSPIGSPFVGVIAERFSTRGAFAYGAAGALVGAVIAHQRRHSTAPVINIDPVLAEPTLTPEGAAT